MRRRVEVISFVSHLSQCLRSSSHHLNQEAIALSRLTTMERICANDSLDTFGTRAMVGKRLYQNEKPASMTSLSILLAYKVYYAK